MKFWIFISWIFVATKNFFVLLNSKIYSKLFYKCGSNFVIGLGANISSPERISIGDDVVVGESAWFSVAPATSAQSAVLIIGDRTYIGRFSTIACVSSVEIESDVLISDRVFIGDALHSFGDLTQPIKDQGVFDAGSVKIGQGSWVGIGVSILPNVTIGKHVIVGANSVVTHSIPDFSVVAGAPAKLIRSLN